MSRNCLLVPSLCDGDDHLTFEETGWSFQTQTRKIGTMTGQQFNLPSSWGSCSDVVQLYTTLLGLSIVNRFPIL